MRTAIRSVFLLLLGFGPLVYPAGAQTAAGDSELVEKENIVETARGKAKWSDAKVGQKIPLRDRLRTGELSRAGVLFSDKSVLRLNELTTMEILPPQVSSDKPTLELENGAIYFFSREKPRELEVRTPAANGALKGTALIVEVRGGLTLLTTLEGEVEFTNAQGAVTVRSGEQGIAEIGKAPRKTAVIDAVNILQWCLYYPAVLDLRELGLDPAKGGALAASLEAYRSGDLLGALEKYPRGAGGGKQARLYRAAVFLAVGQVDKARAALAGVPAGEPGRRAIEEMIAAVKFTDFASAGELHTAGEWMAHSYFQQSRSDLEGALKSAKQATLVSPDFGYAWTRVAELEFSFGRTREALRALDRGMTLAPRNAQAFALKGFLDSAQNRINEAKEAFDVAIGLDGALGNAWLGRGLCSIRQGKDEAGRQDLQIAAAMEPNRSILRSYLGKAFSQNGDNALARSELTRARELDPNDPTPWLYSAVQNKQENRYNEAVRDLEKSITLNDNRRVYRSKFLLDQDRAIRSTNLAAIYQNDGMIEQSLREATRAVNSDYGSAPAHLFLANSYNALRDPTRILLRFETPWFNELLLANLLSPVGGGPLSQFVSQQEYSKLFEADRLGVSTVTDYFSYGELREVASQYGTFGNLSYALDVEYQYNNGLRPNNEISRLESYQNFKLQLGPQDTIFLQSKFQDLQFGEIFQHYDNREVEFTTRSNSLTRVRNTAALTQDFRELQDPALILAGWHHEWAPGVHTLLLVGRLANDQVLTAGATNQVVLTTDASRLIPPTLDANGFAVPTNLSGKQQLAALKNTLGHAPITGFNTLDFNSDYRANFETYTVELSQIVELGAHSLIGGGRYQRGEFTTQQLYPAPLGLDPAATAAFFFRPALRQNLSVDFERINLYAYEVWRVMPWLSLTGGVTYDSLKYPDNFRSPPLNERQASLDKVSPKAGFTLTPTNSTTIRGAYTEAISGTSFDESIRLEPTQVAGFLQAYRTAISEDLVGSVAGSEYKLWGLSFEQKLPTSTYLGVELNVLEQDLDRTIGVFEFPQPGDPSITSKVLPSSLAEKLIYREDSLTATVNQLVGDRWSIGTRYRVTRSKLRTLRPDLPDIFAQRDGTQQSTLHELDLFTLYNHPSGFFARADALWFNQENDGYAAVDDPRTPFDERKPGDNFWQFNLAAGYRFYKNQCEVSCALLNLTGEDYRLNPLNPYIELPRDRTLMVRVKFSF
jgi:tetratricopeptide (TPR) repeat protein